MDIESKEFTKLVDRRENISRRDLFSHVRRVVQLAAAASATSYIVSRDTTVNPVIPQKTVFGTTFRPEEARLRGFNPDEMLDEVLKMDGIRVIRFPLYTHQAEYKNNKWNFDHFRPMMERIVLSGKKLIPVVGLKNKLRPPEIELHPYLRDKVPEFGTPNLILDSNRYLAEEGLRITESQLTVAKDFEADVLAIQAENEPSYPVGFAGGKYFSENYLESVIELVRGHINRPVLVTHPDTPSKFENFPVWLKGLISLASLSDIVGLNIYPQKRRKPTGKLVDFLYWQFLEKVAFPIIRAYQASPGVPEVQSTYWEESGSVTSPFSTKKAFKDFQTLKSLELALILIWDIEQIIDRALRKKDDEHLQMVYSVID